MADQCPAEIVYGSQPRTYLPGEPLAELPMFRCSLDAGHGGVHMTDGVCWNGPAERCKRLAS